jgi:hypothetical protein
MPTSPTPTDILKRMNEAYAFHAERVGKPDHVYVGSDEYDQLSKIARTFGAAMHDPVYWNGIRVYCINQPTHLLFYTLPPSPCG